ncbi:MAG: hypothetical protein WCS37_06150 [Chloroflexota bacterium]|nr:hypothetical protein [Chloroflexota bacterium]
MAVELVLNELSTQTLASDAQTARQIMSDLVQTIRKTTAYGVSKVFRCHSDFYATTLAPSYTLIQWLADKSIDQELRRYFRSLATQVPFLIDRPTEQSNALSFEFKYEGETAYGLGVAFLIDGLAVSLKSHPKWDTSSVEIELLQLDEAAEWVKESASVRHASCPEHLEQYAQWIRSCLKANIKTLEDLWKSRNTLFPSLSFCDEIEEQLQALKTRELMLHPVIKRLFELNDYAKTWQSGPFDSQSLHKATPESQQTLDSYGDQRTFTCADGQPRIFSCHVRLTPDAWRIHFYPLAPGQFFIGYIGPHLPTMKYAT